MEAQVRSQEHITAVLAALERVILGKPLQLKIALVTLLARGHLLIEDLPGMGKTTLAHALAPSVTLKVAVGFTRFGGDITAPNFMDYSVGGAYDFGSGVSLGAAVVGANKQAYFGAVNQSRVVVTLTKTL